MAENTPSSADLLIAMNLDRRLGRPALCRLAGEIAAWTGAGDLASCARRIGVPAGQIARAREIGSRAARLAGEERRKAEELEVRILTRADHDYPAALEELALPPAVLYQRGRPEALAPRRALAIVGARKMDGYGRECARHFAHELAKAGVSIVSGFAIGIDSLAHDAAIEAGGATVAVLGCGLDIDYPAQSRARAAAIAEKGALISEFPLGWPPRPYNFPIRNRLIAALSGATLVIQAKLRSGSLITAHHALDLGRDVFAVPGRIFDELAMGTNNLIADGAHPARCAKDILERLGIEAPAAPLLATEAPAPVKAGKPNPLLSCLAQHRDGMLAEDLAAELGQDLDQVLGTLLELELEGRVERRPGPLYVARSGAG
jgi:DNA processing protein